MFFFYFCTLVSMWTRNRPERGKLLSTIIDSKTPFLKSYYAYNVSQARW